MGNSPVMDGRACRECSLCCRILGVDEIDKPQNTSCPNCAVGGGCKIYESRPPGCRDFFCGYLTLPMMGEAWFPTHCRMVVYPAPEGNRLTIHVDPDRPDAWRSNPYYSEIRLWAKLVANRDFQVLVCIDMRTIAILPDGEQDLGVVEPDERVVYGFTLKGGRRVRTASKRKVK